MRMITVTEIYLPQTAGVLGSIGGLSLGGVCLYLWTRLTGRWQDSLDWAQDRDFKTAWKIAWGAHPASRTQLQSGAILRFALLLGFSQLALHILSHESFYLVKMGEVTIPASAALFPLTLALLLYACITRNSLVFGWLMAFLLLSNASVAGLTYGIHLLVPESSSRWKSLWSASAWKEVVAGTMCFFIVTLTMVYTSVRMEHSRNRSAKVLVPLGIALLVDAIFYPLTLWAFRDDALSQLYWPHVFGHLLCELPLGLAAGLALTRALPTTQEKDRFGMSMRSAKWAIRSTWRFFAAAGLQFAVGLTKRVSRRLSFLTRPRLASTRRGKIISLTNAVLLFIYRAFGRIFRFGYWRGRQRLDDTRKESRQHLAREQFERDRERLLADPANHGRFVAYLGATPLFEGRTDGVRERLIAQCKGLGHKPGEYAVFKIEPREVSEAEPAGARLTDNDPSSPVAPLCPENACSNDLRQQAQEQFERDRERLLADPANHGRFVAYLGATPLFEGRTDGVRERLIAQCRALGHKPGEYAVFKIEPREVSESVALGWF
jgi:hypothetical protein